MHQPAVVGSQNLRTHDVVFSNSKLRASTYAARKSRRIGEMVRAACQREPTVEPTAVVLWLHNNTWPMKKLCRRTRKKCAGQNENKLLLYVRIIYTVRGGISERIFLKAFFFIFIRIWF